MNINNDRKSNNNEYDDNDSNNNDDDCIFSFRTDNIKIISDVLQCLSSTQCPNGICIIEATPSSLIIFTSNKSKSLEARITWNSILFDDYICNHDSIKLCINLNILIDCLLLFGNTSDTILASFSYSSNESIFKLSLEEFGIITTCDITCLYNDNDNDLYELECGLFVSFRNAEIESQIIVQSEHLKDAILELIEINGANQVKITIQNNPKTMKMLSKGAVGTCEIEFPRSSDVFVKFDCFNNATWSYPLASLALGMKALGVAKETYIRINANGVACVQHQIETTKEFEVYVDFIIAALETDIE